MSLYKIIIYMPAFNEQRTIRKVLESIPKKFKEFKEVELLVVNDGSIDDTEKEAIAAGAKVINHFQNRGVGIAFQTAINYALANKADILVSIDADGQFDVDQINEMIIPIIEKQADFCTGNRFYNCRPTNMPKVKYFGNNLISKIVSFVSKTKIIDASCGFRAYSRDCLFNLNLQGSFTYTHETILDLLHKGYKISQIAVNVKYFDGRVSRIANNLFVYGFQTSVIIFRCFKDYRPLPFFLTIATGVFILALLMTTFVFINWLNTGMITPYKSLGFISLFLFSISLIISVLAFLADMLNRIRKNQEKILFLTKKKYFEED